MPPITVPSKLLPIDGACGAILGKYKQPNPSLDMSISTNGGSVHDACARKSRGVVIDTNVLIRVNCTEPPDLYGLTKFGLSQHSGMPNRRNSRNSVGCRA